VGSIMKCNTLESGKEYVILSVYVNKIPSLGFTRAGVYRYDA